MNESHLIRSNDHFTRKDHHSTTIAHLKSTHNKLRFVNMLHGLRSSVDTTGLLTTCISIDTSTHTYYMASTHMHRLYVCDDGLRVMDKIEVGIDQGEVKFYYCQVLAYNGYLIVFLTDGKMGILIEGKILVLLLDVKYRWLLSKLDSSTDSCRGKTGPVIVNDYLYYLKDDQNCESQMALVRLNIKLLIEAVKLDSLDIDKMINEWTDIIVKNVQSFCFSQTQKLIYSIDLENRIFTTSLPQLKSILKSEGYLNENSAAVALKDYLIVFSKPYFNVLSNDLTIRAYSIRTLKLLDTHKPQRPQSNTTTILSNLHAYTVNSCTSIISTIDSNMRMDIYTIHKHSIVHVCACNLMLDAGQVSVDDIEDHKVYTYKILHSAVVQKNRKIVELYLFGLRRIESLHPVHKLFRYEFRF